MSYLNDCRNHTQNRFLQYIYEVLERMTHDWIHKQHKKDDFVSHSGDWYLLHFMMSLYYGDKFDFLIVSTQQCMTLILGNSDDEGEDDGYDGEGVDKIE